MNGGSTRLHLLGERDGSGGDRTGRSGNGNAKDEKGKAPGADEVRLEMTEEVGVEWTGRLLNLCMQEGRIPKEWMMGLIVPI